MIVKVTCTVTVLAKFATLEEAAADFANAGLPDVLIAIDVGDMAGSSVLNHVVEVPPENVQAELEAVGDDGSFFEQEDNHGG